MTEMIVTLDALKRFQGAGFPDPQAHALVEVFRDLGRQSQASLATKDDLRIFEARFEALIATTKNDIVRWMIGSQMILVAALVALSSFTKVFG